MAIVSDSSQKIKKRQPVAIYLNEKDKEKLGTGNQGSIKDLLEELFAQKPAVTIEQNTFSFIYFISRMKMKFEFFNYRSELQSNSLVNGHYKVLSVNGASVLGC